MAEPLRPCIVPFPGDEVIAVRRPISAVLALFARLCENPCLVRRSQVRRVQNHAVLSTGLVLLSIHTESGVQEIRCLRLDLLALWRSAAHAGRVKAELQPKLVCYPDKAAVVLWQDVEPQILVEQTAVEPVVDEQAIQQPQQIAEMGRAIGRMAEQQIELQRQPHPLVGTMDTAGRVIKDVQGQLGNVEARPEDRLHPSYITGAQASEVSHRVKALAELAEPQGSRQESLPGHLHRAVPALRTEQLQADPCRTICCGITVPGGLAQCGHR